MTPVQFAVPRDGLQRPMVVPREGGKPLPYTRTTTFIDCIEDKSALSDWKLRSVLLGAANHPAIAAGVLALDPSDEKYKAKLDEIAQEAMELSGANEKREKGTDLHGYSELADAGLPMPDSASVTDRLDMAEYVLTVAKYGLTFSHVEKFVVIPELKVGGTPDRICHYIGPGPGGTEIEGDFIFDLKTGTVTYGGLKMASQLAAYSRAWFYDPTIFPAPPYAAAGKPGGKEWAAWKATKFEPELAETAYTALPPVNREWGIILNLPSGSSKAELYWADLTLGWSAAELALDIRAMRSKTGKALIKFADPDA